MNVAWLADPKQAGVFHFRSDPREFGNEAAGAGFKVYRLDIGHAHDKADFLGHVSKAMAFPDTFGHNWDAFADAMKDLSWAESGKGWVIILEKSKHFCAGHHHEFEEAMDVMDEAAEFWRGQGKALWTFIGGPEGWQSGWPDMPAT